MCPNFQITPLEDRIRKLQAPLVSAVVYDLDECFRFRVGFSEILAASILFWTKDFLIRGILGGIAVRFVQFRPDLVHPVTRAASRDARERFFSTAGALLGCSRSGRDCRMW